MAYTSTFPTSPAAQTPYRSQRTKPTAVGGDQLPGGTGGQTPPRPPAAATPAPVAPVAPVAPPGQSYQGIGSGQSRTGIETLNDIQRAAGRTLTPEEQAYARNYINYTDPNGTAAINHTDYNRLMQHAAQQWGGTYQEYAPPAPTPGGPLPNQGPVYHTPIEAPTIEAVPGYTPPEYQQQAPYQQERFVAPDPAQVANDPYYQFRMQQGAGALQQGAGAAGMDRTSRTDRALVAFGQGLAGEEAQRAYDRAANTYSLNTDERRYGYGADVGEGRYGYEARTAEAQARYAPSLLGWQTRTDANQRNAELNFDRRWQQEVYGRDDAYRRDRAGADDSRYNRDDMWRRYQLEENRRLQLAGFGLTAASA